MSLPALYRALSTRLKRPSQASRLSPHRSPHRSPRRSLDLPSHLHVERASRACLRQLNEDTKGRLRSLHLVAFLLVTLPLGSLSCGGVERKDQLEDARYHHKLAYGYFFESHDSEAALQEVLKSIKLSAKLPEVQMLAGLIYTGRQNLLKAIQHYQNALALKPDYYEAKNNLGTVYLSQGDWRRASTIFSELTNNDDYSTPALGFNNLGWAQYKLGQYDAALRALITASQLNPKLCPPHNNIALIYLKRDDLERAERSLNRCLKLCPSYAEPHLHLGRVHARRGALESAQQMWARCVKLSPDNDLGLRCTRLLRESQRLR